MSGLEQRFGDMLTKPRKGLIYYIACTETKRLKIGYTKHKPEKRLKALQTGSASDLVLIAVHPGNPEDEQWLHDHFSEQRLRGEWFAMSEDLFKFLCMVTWMAARAHILLGHPLEDWVRTGLRAMQDHTGELPADIAALIA